MLMSLSHLAWWYSSDWRPLTGHVNSWKDVYPVPCLVGSDSMSLLIQVCICHCIVLKCVVRHLLSRCRWGRPHIWSRKIYSIPVGSLTLLVLLQGVGKCADSKTYATSNDDMNSDNTNEVIPLASRWTQLQLGYACRLDDNDWVWLGEEVRIPIGKPTVLPALFVCHCLREHTCNFDQVSIQKRPLSVQWEEYVLTGQPRISLSVTLFQ